jgi:protein-S-isoprenylcysteine O-methyltransferase Ste14
MDAKKKPSVLTAILFTVAAVCSLMTCLLLLTRDNRSGGLIAFGLLTSALLVVSAIGNWVTYFRRWVDFEIERRREGTTTKE